MFYNSEEYKEVVATSRLQGACAFMKSPVFDSIVDVRVFDELVITWERCIAQSNSWVVTRRILAPAF
ncbi:UNVERIFIED_CONTAM: hypothetical protein Slati_0926300 [Sesamum latifolium]|uniref:SnoaL-like domain-containing protein n=1 Tax=Sesamum latifolium TaxID=2727402 RepID=A0AAW2XQ49_9LAMI